MSGNWQERDDAVVEVDQLPLPYVQFDGTGTVERVNRAWTRTFGHHPDDVIGERFDSLLPAEDVARFHTSVAQGPAELDGHEFGLIDADGNVRSVLLEATVSTEGDWFGALLRDVTDNRAESQDAARYRQLVDSMLEAACIYDAEGRFEVVNEFLADWYGTTPAELVGRSSNLIPKIREQSEGDPFEELVAGDRAAVTGEVADEFPGHGYAVLEYRLSRLEVDGEVDGVVGVTRDVTVQRQVKRRLSTLLDNLPGMVYRCLNEPGWPMTYVGGHVVELTGYAAEDIESGDVSWGRDVIHPDDRERVWADVQAAVDRADPFELTYRIVTRADEERWVWEQGREVEDDPNGPYLEGFITDVTDRKRAEQEHRRFERAVEAAGHAIYVTDTDGTIQYVNPAFEAITGYDAGEAVGRNPRLLNSGEKSKGYYQRLWNTILRGEVLNEEIVNERANGSTYHALQTIAPIETDDGDIEGFVAVQTDITEERERDRQLQILDRILRHNVRNRANVISGFAELVAAEGASPVDGYADPILGATDDLVEMTEKEREITRILATGPEQTSLDLADVVRMAVADCRSASPGARIETDVEEGQVVASPHLPKAVEELLDNAIRHNERSDPTVSVRVATEQSRAILEVEDDGPGIPEMEQEILEGGSEEDPLYHGTGLGFWLVALVLERSQATLEVEPVEPRGTRIRIRLSAVEE